MINGKRKIRDIGIPDKSLQELRTYCEENNLKEGCIFTSKTGKPIKRISIYKMIVNMADSIGIEKEKDHPHNFRHLFAVTYMEHHGNLFELADILGHSSIETTRIYARITTELKRQKMNELGL